MSESLRQRVGRLIAGGFNALVDAVENAAPEATMEQAIREIDTAINEVRNELGVVEAQRHLTSKRLAEDGQRVDTLDDQAKLALAEGREDLAEAAVSRQIDLETQLPVLEARLADLGDEKTKLEGYVSALQAKKREMRDALQSYQESRRVAGQSSSGQPEQFATDSGGGQARAERAGDAFDRVFRRQTGLQSGSGGGIDDEARLSELEEMARQNRVRERLLRLKSETS